MTVDSGRWTVDGKSFARSLSIAVVVFSVHCLLSPVHAFAQSDDGIQRITRDIIPQVERATDLKFKRPPVVAVRSREQVRQFLDRKIAAEYPPAEIGATQRAYRALHLVPDTLDLRQLILDLYSEQVAGFYDPDSAMLFVVRGADPQMVRVILAHELVHALQDQYTQLNSVLNLRRQNDRQMAGQAVMEGQATLASLVAMSGGNLPDMTQFWTMAREGIRQQQSSMPVFAAAPLILQEGMLFPYLAGAEFMQHYEDVRANPQELPYNERLPLSTEQILHISKYTGHERPLRLAIPATSDTVIYEDDFGEFDTRTALRSWGVEEARSIAAAAGWNGDRYAILGTRAGTAALWMTAWDTPADAQEFERSLREAWQRVAGSGTGRRWQIDVLDVSGTKVVRLADAPASWTGWARLPVPRITR